MNSLQMIIKYWFKSRKNFVLSFLYQMVYVIFSLITPIFIGKLVGSVSNSGASTYRDIWINFAIVIISGYFAYLFNKVGRVKSAEVSTRALYELRKDINTSIYRQSFSYFDKHETGQLVSRATSDVEQTRMIFGFGLATGLQSVIQLIGIIITTFTLDASLAIIFLAIIPISLIISLLLTMKLKPIYLKTRETFGDLTNTIRENIIGAEVVRIFSKQSKENGKFDKNNKKFYHASINSIKFSSFFNPVNKFLISGLTVAIVFFGGIKVINGDLTIDTIVTLVSYAGLTAFPLSIFSEIMRFYIQADAALVRIREVLESAPEIEEKNNAVPIEKLDGRVKFEHVSFGYTKSTTVLNDINFEVQEGKKLAILGTTGSGKSTIISLLPRFYDVHDGKIEIDNVDIRDFVIKDLRANIGVVSQETFLFNKSIKENIRYGKSKASMEEIINAAKNANLHEFIMSLPKGYDTVIGERGTRLSGGQKQRLSIARALIIKPKIIIFDDSTSSVDVETEFKIQQALEQIMSSSTTFIITQRLSTIRNADKILLLDKGRTVGFGKHEDLINNNVLYKQIYQTLHKKQKELLTENIKTPKSEAYEDGGIQQ